MLYVYISGNVAAGSIGNAAVGISSAAGNIGNAAARSIGTAAGTIGSTAGTIGYAAAGSIGSAAGTIGSTAGNVAAGTLGCAAGLGSAAVDLTAATLNAANQGNKNICKPENFNTNIARQLFHYTITFVNSQD